MREKLPLRRAATTIDVVHQTMHGSHQVVTACLGFYEDGRIGEVFLYGSKVGTEVDVATKDGAILLSFALQHGVKLADVRSAMTRDATGAPEGIMGTVIEAIVASGYQEPGPLA